MIEPILDIFLGKIKPPNTFSRAFYDISYDEIVSSGKGNYDEGVKIIKKAGKKLGVLIIVHDSGISVCNN